MFLSESKRLSRIKEQYDGWNAIAELLLSEYSKISPTEDLQKLLEMCCDEEIDRRVISGKLERSLKSICGKYNIPFELIPTQLKLACRYAKDKRQEFGTKFRSVEYRYSKLIKLKRYATVGAIIVASVTAIAIIYKPICYKMASNAEAEGNYAEALNTYTILGNYKDSEAKIASLTNTQDVLADYDSAMQKYNDGDYYNAYREFVALDYKDSQAMASKAKDTIVNSTLTATNKQDAYEKAKFYYDLNIQNKQFTQRIMDMLEPYRWDPECKVIYQKLQDRLESFDGKEISLSNRKNWLDGDNTAFNLFDDFAFNGFSFSGGNYKYGEFKSLNFGTNDRQGVAGSIKTYECSTVEVMGELVTVRIEFDETEISGQREFVGISWKTNSSDFSQDIYEQVAYAVCDTIGCNGDTYKFVLDEETGNSYVAYFKKDGKVLKLSCNFDAPTVQWTLGLAT